MADTKTIKTIVPTTFEEIQNDIIKMFKDKGYDADIQGSNASLFAKIVAYCAYSTNVNTSFNVGEMLLPKAQYRKNILYGARMFGYEAERQSSYVYTIKLSPLRDDTLGEQDTTKRTYTIPKYTSFSNGSKFYYYMGETISFQLSNKDITDNNPKVDLNIKEGELKLYNQNQLTQVFTLQADTQGNVQTKISLPYTNIEKNGTEVFMTYFDQDKGMFITDELWNLSPQFMIDADTDILKKYFEMVNIEFGTLDILFRVGTIGNKLLAGSVAKVNVLLTNGINGFAENTQFDLVEPLQNISVDDGYSIFQTGTNEETNSSIKNNATIFHNSANRAVVKNDYVAICSRLTLVDKVQVWGGDEENPIALGHIFFSFLPEYRDKNFNLDENTKTYSLNDSFNTWYLKDTEVLNTSAGSTSIFDILDTYKIMTMQLHNRQPIYVDFNYKVRVIKYPIAISESETHKLLFDSTNDFFKSSIENFGSTYFHSNLVKRLDSLLNDNSGLQVKLEMKIPLYKKNVEPYINGGQSIYIALAIPFENIEGLGDSVITDVLPNIDTQNFIGAENLSIDLQSKTGSFNTGLIEYDIKLGASNIGKYQIYYGNKRYIIVRLDIASKTELTDNTPLYLNLSTPSSNIVFNRNTIARLKSMQFVDENQPI